MRALKFVITKDLSKSFDAVNHNPLVREVKSGELKKT